MNIDIGSKIKALRLSKSMTQEQLAKALHVSAQAVSKWESGSSLPDIQLLPALSVTLGDACDAAVHFKFELDKDGMPHSRMVYETPLDAMFAIIGNAFITASTMVRRTAVCDWCGKVFPAKTKRAQYCSYRCQKAGWRAKQKLKEDKSNNVKTETQGE